MCCTPVLFLRYSVWHCWYQRCQTIVIAFNHAESIASHVVPLPNLACRCRLNNPSAHTFCDNCNVLLSAAMDKAGLSEYCDASEEVQELLPHMRPRPLYVLPSWP